MEYNNEAVVFDEGVSNSGNGSGGEDVGDLCFEDEELVPGAMHALNMMRKNRHFCDVVLHTGSAEVPAHRAVLAAASPYLMELFTTDQDRYGGSSSVVLPLSYKLSGPCERKALQSLVGYAYTGKLCVPANQVRSVYLCAWQLRMDSVVARCGRFLAGSWLARDTCLAVRALPGLVGSARNNVDKYIADNFSSLYKSSTLSALPLIQVEVLYTTRSDMDLMEHNVLADLMLQWLRDQITGDEHVDVHSLVGRTHLLYISGGGGLRDCAALPPQHSDTPLLQDYRRMLLKCPKNGKRNGNGNGSGPGTNGANPSRQSSVYSRDIAERAHRQPGDDWAVIVSEKLAEHTFLSLCTLDGHLALVSASLRLNESPLPSPAGGITMVPPGCATTQNNGTTHHVPTSNHQQPLAPLDRPRCAHGVAVLNGKIIVCGGYDRVECLNSVESYDPERNKWTQLPDMRQQRGRFNIAQVGDRIYAVGGSDGHIELDSVEMYQAPPDDGGDSSSRSMSTSLESQSGSIEDAAQLNGTVPVPPQQAANKKKAWSKRGKLPLARSYAGVCGGAEGNIYCVGGWAGQAGIRDCQIYNTQQDTWSEMAPLNTGRYQAGVCVWGEALWAVGGCDAWHCLATTERFSQIVPSAANSDDSWHFGPSLSVARRGCGVAVWAGKLVCAGGSDGQHSLRSVEVLTGPSGCWEPGPPLREPRGGLGLTALADRLYAIGGFSGKIFLSSIEYIAEGMEEWTSFTIPFPTQIFTHDTSRGSSPPKVQSITSSIEKMKVNGQDTYVNGDHKDFSKGKLESEDCSNIKIDDTTKKVNWSKHIEVNKSNGDVHVTMTSQGESNGEEGTPVICD